MCTDRKIFVSRSHLLNMSKFQPGYITCDCGKCLECIEAKKQEYFIRGTYEALNVIDKHGFVVFDTLTYDPKFRPTLRDKFPGLPSYLNYSCFSRDDVQLFLKRLRKNNPCL